MKRDGMEVLDRVMKVSLPDGKTLAMTPLTVGDYASCREQSLDFYRTDQIGVWTKNANLMPEDERKAWIKEAFQNAAKVSYEDLPDKTVREADGTEKPYEYFLWWISSVPDGILFAIWLSARRVESQKHLTYDDIRNMFTLGNDLDEKALDDVGQALGDLSTPKLVGNGDAPPTAGPQTTKRRRRRRK